MSETKREKFIRLAENRTNKVLNSIKNLSNLGNKVSYDYNEEDVKQIFRAIENEVRLAKLKFTEQEQKKFKLKDKK